MACPKETNNRALNGKFVMNKSLSDNLDSMLALQGLSWFTRKAISFATVTLTIKEYQDDKSLYHIDISSNASGLSTTQENRTMDWEDRPHKDKIFGNVKGRSRLVKLSTTAFEPCEPYNESDTQFLQGKILKDGTTASKFLEDEVVQSYVKNQDAGHGWSAEQVWNFEEVQGKRYYTRRIVSRSSDGTKSERVRLVYDYLGVTKEEDDGLAYGEE
ncbi:hypothetical protein LTS08_000595 [Lithohypha guttulata]|uniref:Uncharacterized protein n=1 Tax=Lithohypha guttulata TaxID=1690604 RepID=A0AAN7T5C2_9EURO|nr:hypothetical protein LTR51_006956 [Lithohypha guttulata]KAK5089003.1 hypothetical protein LTR05_003227 [Lithohypha guttulata]KAK5106476.1 hypothetical protein LTS08_000595 [Lithohypha guttulata]